MTEFTWRALLIGLVMTVVLGASMVAVGIVEGIAEVRLDAAEIAVQVHDSDPRRLIGALRAAADRLEGALGGGDAADS